MNITTHSPNTFYDVPISVLPFLIFAMTNRKPDSSNFKLYRVEKQYSSEEDKYNIIFTEW